MPRYYAFRYYDINRHRDNHAYTLRAPQMSLVDGVSTWASYQIRTIAGCACARNAGNCFPRHRLQRMRCRHASRHVRHARAVMHVGMADPRWWGRRSRHSGACATRNFTYLARGPLAGIQYNLFYKIDDESATLGRSRSLILIILHHRMRYIEFIISLESPEAALAKSSAIPRRLTICTECVLMRCFVAGI